MQEGKLVRFEEITRCPLELQDTLLSVLSERVMAVPEREDEGRTLYARGGFNVVATANTRDRGVNEMSAALKRRFNFETVPPIESVGEEMALVQRETDRLLRRAAVPLSLPPDLTEVLVTTCHELRRGQTADGKALDPLSTVLSTAEAVSVGYAAVLHAYYYGAPDGALSSLPFGPGSRQPKVLPEHVVQSLLGSALKDSPEDLQKLRHYFQNVVRDRRQRPWPDFYAARRYLD
jgi:hypothetical protein